MRRNTLFHEFGHGLHGLFRDVHYSGVSGVPRDFVELPSQVMEHWVFEPEVLKVYAKHYQTGEVIPAELIEKLDKSGKYGTRFRYDGVSGRLLSGYGLSCIERDPCRFGY